ncbi:DUF4214 domain-containing protein [Peribacillus sp. NPDC094092]|uniref:DUF4214 domain-containing protein n=1 Tax=Peribacillus sp. NPDC094092 TaxID=3390611 RepID=UPI003D022D3A
MIAKTIGGIDIKEAFKLLHLDKSWSGLPAGMTNYVYPGCGFGGYCLPDVDFVQNLYQELLFREPDEGGLHGFVTYLRHGGSRTTVIESILTSPECTELLTHKNPPWI